MPEQDMFGYKRREQQRTLEREILRYLRTRKQSVNWIVLTSAHCNPNQPDLIGLVLGELRDGRYISVDEKRNVSITDVGLKRLESGMF
jgi:hypothetical protein